MQHSLSTERADQAIHHLTLALKILRLATIRGAVGRGVAQVRQDILTGAAPGPKVSKVVARQLFHTLSDQRAEDMPLPDDLLPVLIETISVRFGGIPNAQVWELVGIAAGRGRNIMWGDSPITWPEYVVLWDASIGPARHVARRPPPFAERIAG